MPVDLAAVRTALFVPGDRPDRFDTALASGADLVVVDLEDAVDPGRRATAREHVAALLGRAPTAPVAVRVNAAGTPDHPLDADLVRAHRCAVLLAKADDAAAAEALVPCPVVALVETARGVLAAPAVAASCAVTRLALGHLDLAAELGVDPDDRTAMTAARSALVLASAAAGLAPPIDGVTVDVTDDARLTDDVRHARSLGLGGKLCIHPRQVTLAAAALAPSPDDVAWARRVVAAADTRGTDAVTVLDGRMVDRPVVERARRILDHPHPAPEGLA
ncbi:aldolase/citrate lyase family protein [Nocardioides sp. C4-1]|uniref:HpcH/HpaI aldolase/citrate lyase family protein n=1 Tax=Nocardioides sp. C4-1 TaxID=3151851 RepID=UPI0032665823